MKRIFNLQTSLVIILLIAFINPTSAIEPKAIPRVEILTPGMIRLVEVTQNGIFPQDFSQILLIVIAVLYKTIYKI